MKRNDPIQIAGQPGVAGRREDTHEKTPRTRDDIKEVTPDAAHRAD
jgi:hypothetical protein